MATVTKYALGPWKVDDDREFIVVDDSHNPRDIACSELNGDEGLAAAKLIAAAPDLLAALKELLAMCQRQADFNDDGDGCMYDRARAAIAKATS